MGTSLAQFSFRIHLLDYLCYLMVRSAQSMMQAVSRVELVRLLAKLCLPETRLEIIIIIFVESGVRFFFLRPALDEFFERLGRIG